MRTAIEGQRMENASYGTEFLQHLQAISRSTPYGYKDLQQIKSMTQQELAEKLRTQYREFSEIILANDAKTAAEMIHRKTLDTTHAAASAQGAAGLGSVGEVFTHLLQCLSSAF